MFSSLKTYAGRFLLCFFLNVNDICLGGFPVIFVFFMKKKHADENIQNYGTFCGYNQNQGLEEKSSHFLSDNHGSVTCDLGACL